MLSPEAIARIDSLCAQLDHSAANAQIAMVTIHTLDGDDAADYANQLEDKWKMGSKGSDRGVLMLLAVDDHKYRIDVGYGLEGILPDGKVGDIGREMVPVSAGQRLRQRRDAGRGRDGPGDRRRRQGDAGRMSRPASRPASQMHHSSAFGKLILLLFVLIFFGGSSPLRHAAGLWPVLEHLWRAKLGAAALAAVDWEAAADLAAAGAVVGLADSAAGALAAEAQGEAGRIFEIRWKGCPLRRAGGEEKQYEQGTLDCAWEWWAFWFSWC